MEGEAPATARRRRGPLRIALAGVLGLALLVAALAIGIDTGPGHRLIVRQIAALNFANGMRVSVGRIEGSIYGAMTLHDLALKDSKGAFLTAPSVAVDWRPFAYLRSHVDIRSTSAPRVVLHRVPALKVTPKTDAPLLPDLDIDVGALRIDQFIAEPAVAGERRVLNLWGSGHIADGRAQLRAAARTLAIEGQGAGDRLAVRLDARPADQQLDIDLALDAPAGGVIAALAGIDQPLAIRLGGRGNWGRWDGTLAADLGGADLARLALGARSGTFAVKGPLRVDRLLGVGATRMLAPVANLDLAAAFTQRRAKLSGSVTGDNFRIVPDGVIDLGENRFDQFRVKLALSGETRLAENLSGSGLAADLTANGTFVAPEIAYRLQASRLMVGSATLTDLAATGTARGGREQWLIPVKAQARQIAGLETIAGGSLANVTLDGDLAARGPRLVSDNLRIWSDRVDARVILTAEVDRGRYAGAIDGRIDQYRLASVGIFTVQTRLDLQQRGAGFQIAGTVRTRSTSLANETLRTTLGGNLAASADLAYGADGIGRFDNLRLTAPELRVTGGRGAWYPDGRISLEAAGTSPRYGALGLRLGGTMANPDARITASKPGLGIGLANLEARITTAPGGYRLDAKGETDYGPLQADVTLGLGAGTALQINRANLSGVDFAGNLTRTAAGPFAGTLSANGNGVTGTLRLGAEGRYQAADFDLKARNAVFAGPARLSVGAANATGRLVLFERPQVNADVEVSSTRLGAFDLAAARVKVDYRDGRGHAAALVEGTSGAPFRLGLNADLAPNLWRVALQGRVRGQTIRTLSPARIVPGKSRYELLPASLAVGGGTARIAGTYGPGLNLQSRIEGIDLGVLNAFVPGYGIGGGASGSIDFAQASPGAVPRAEARLMLTDFTRTNATTISQPVAVNFIGKLAPEGSEARAVIRRQGKVIGRLVASLGPLAAAGGDWTTRLGSAPLRGGIRYDGNADTLFSLTGQTGQSITGPLSLAADFSCQVSDPCLNGVVRGRNLTYENLAYGTRLTNLEFAGRFTGNNLDLSSLKAQAGSGTISASGRIGLSAAAGYPIDLTATLSQARLARGEALSASATGTLRLTKQAGQARFRCNAKRSLPARRGWLDAVWPRGGDNGVRHRDEMAVRIKASACTCDPPWGQIKGVTGKLPAGQ